jgi:biotin synthase
MMSRWGLQGMQSFEQLNVARKEGSRLEGVVSGTGPNRPRETELQAQS